MIAAIVDRKKGLHALIACVIGIFFSDQIVGHSLKWLWPRLRPYQYLEGVRVLGHKWTNGSFPSGHTDSIVAGAVILSYFYPGMAVSLYIFSALTCFSRVYNGMHHPLDVCVGALIGIASGCAIIALYRWKIEKPRSCGAPSRLPSGGRELPGMTVSIRQRSGRKRLSNPCLLKFHRTRGIYPLQGYCIFYSDAHRALHFQWPLPPRWPLR